MSKQVRQFRFYDYKNEHNKNYPILYNQNEEPISGTEFANKFIDGTLFSNYNRIIQLGIQSLPGTKFQLNNSTGSVIIGHTGIYELTLEGKPSITSMSVASPHLK